VLVNGGLAAYIPRGAREMTAFVPEDEPARSTTGRSLAAALVDFAQDRGLLIAAINGRDPSEHALTPYLIEAGFHASAMGLQIVRSPSPSAPARQAGAANRRGRHA
jgi:ATP-dependent helicase Lhr and Lhr-like helicase